MILFLGDKRVGLILFSNFGFAFMIFSFDGFEGSVIFLMWVCLEMVGLETVLKVNVVLLVEVIVKDFLLGIVMMVGFFWLFVEDFLFCVSFLVEFILFLFIEVFFWLLLLLKLLV